MEFDAECPPNWVGKHETFKDQQGPYPNGFETSGAKKVPPGLTIARSHEWCGAFDVKMMLHMSPLHACKQGNAILEQLNTVGNICLAGLSNRPRPPLNCRQFTAQL